MSPRPKTPPLCGVGWTDEEWYIIFNPPPPDVRLSERDAAEMAYACGTVADDHPSDDRTRLDASNRPFGLEMTGGMYEGEEMKKAEDREGQGGCATLVCILVLCGSIAWRVQPLPRTKPCNYPPSYINDSGHYGLEPLMPMVAKVRICPFLKKGSKIE